MTTAQPNTIADLVPTTTEATPDAVRKSIEATAEASREAEQQTRDKEREDLRKQQEEARQAEEELEQQEDEPEPASAYNSSCADARAAGAAPMRRGEPGYRKGLDRDNDGVACDT
ncbi:excalibur calcium-binding domain-containing protein [Actinoplanes sp. NPDC049599]|uniref:excalibur calcium-binding domain-containing protein n=1 Tax=Actinoplanes sp. NPDC049599 TaxID=3363903 RepID=UPI00378F61A2